MVEQPAAKEPEVTRKETIHYEEGDKIITEETITKEESIIFGEQIIRTAPQYVSVEPTDASADGLVKRQRIQETVEFDANQDKQVEEETCVLDASLQDDSLSAEPTNTADPDLSSSSQSFEKIDKMSEDVVDQKDEDGVEEENRKEEKREKEEADKKEDSTGSDVDQSLED